MRVEHGRVVPGTGELSEVSTQVGVIHEMCHVGVYLRDPMAHVQGAFGVFLFSNRPM